MYVAKLLALIQVIWLKGQPAYLFNQKINELPLLQKWGVIH
jgi:hypothetical protein